MEISWFGHACFRIRAREATILTDPFDRSIGQLPKVAAEIVTVSHPHPAHNNVAAVGGTPKVVAGPGEYEVAGVFITGVRTYHDTVKGKERGNNAVYLMEADELVVCHLGDLGHVPDAAQTELISNVDVLLVPVGGGATLDAAAAVETVRRLEPKIVIPMHFQSERTPDLDPLEKFLGELGVTEAAPQARLQVGRSSLPPQLQVVVLDPRS